MRGSRNFRQGGGSRSVWTTGFFFCYFFSPQLILQKSNGQFQRNPIIFQGSRGGLTFSRGGPTFSRVGSNCLFPIETHITCDFPGGGVRTPCPPLWIRTWGSSLFASIQTCILWITALINQGFFTTLGQWRIPLELGILARKHPKMGIFSYIVKSKMHHIDLNLAILLTYNHHCMMYYIMNLCNV